MKYPKKWKGMSDVNESEADYWSKQIDDKELNALADAGDKINEESLHPEVARRLAANPTLKALIEKGVLIPFSSRNGMFEVYVYRNRETKEWYLHGFGWKFDDSPVKGAFAEGRLLSFDSGIYLIPLFSYIQSLKWQISVYGSFTEMNASHPLLSTFLGVNVKRLGDPGIFMGWFDFLSSLYEKLETYTPPAPKEVITPEKVTSEPEEKSNCPAWLAALVRWGIVAFLGFTALGAIVLLLKAMLPSLPEGSTFCFLVIAVFLFYYFRSKAQSIRQKIGFELKNALKNDRDYAKFIYFKAAPRLFLLGLISIIITWLLISFFS